MGNTKWLFRDRIHENKDPSHYCEHPCDGVNAICFNQKRKELDEHLKGR